MELIGGGETLETLRVIIEAQTRPYQQEMARVRTVTQQATAQVEQQTQKMSKAVSKVGAIVKMALGVVGVKAIFDFGKSCVKLGSDLAEVQNVVNVTFGNMSKEVDKFAKEAIGQFGLSETMAKKYMGTYGAMAKAFGITGQAGYDMSAAITGLTGDVASFYNMSQDEAYTKLKSIFTGETESLKDLGVVMTQTALNQYALNNGFGKTTAQMTEQEKVMLRYQFVMGQLSLAQGDFQRTGGGWANQVRVLQLRFDSLKATIGQGLINALLPVIKVLNSIIERLQVAAESFKVFTEALFGKNVESTGGAGSTPQTGNTGNPDLGNNLADSTGDAAGNTGVIADNLADSAKQAQKIERALMSFDEINKISDTGTVSSATDIPNSLVTNPIGDFSKVGVLSDVNKELDKTKEKASAASEKVKEMLESLAEKAKPATDALKKLWDEGLSKLGNFAWGVLKDFWNYFLKPLGSWMLGEEGLPRFFEITNDLLNEIDWKRLRKSLRELFIELQKLVKFVWTGLMDFYEYFLKPIAKWSMNEGIPRFIDATKDMIKNIDWDKLNEALKKLWKVLEPFTEGVGEGLITFYEGLTGIGAEAINILAEALNKLGDALLKLDPNILNELGRNFGIFIGVLATLKISKGLISKVGGLYEGLKNIFSMGGGSAAVGTQSAVAAGGGIFSWLKELGKNAFYSAGMMEMLEDTIGQTDKIAEGEKYGGLIGALRELSDNGKITEQDFNNFYGTLLTAKTKSVPFQDALVTVEDSLSRMGISTKDFETTLSDTLDSMGVSAPEKAKILGLGLGSGTVVGLEESKKKVADSAKGYGEEIVAWFKNGFGDLGGLGRELINGFAEGFKSIHIPLPHIDLGWNDYNVGSLNFRLPSFNGIEWYARGGFPENGQMFVANESGPEMVGRMGNRNAVANNNQIIAGIEAGVFRAVSNAFSSNTGEGKDMTVNVYLEGDAKALFRVVRKEGLNYSNSTGTPVFPT